MKGNTGKRHTRRENQLCREHHRSRKLAMQATVWRQAGRDTRFSSASALCICFVYWSRMRPNGVYWIRVHSREAVENRENQYRREI